MLEEKRIAGKEGGGAATKKLRTLARGFLDIMLQADPIEPQASELRYVFKKVPHPIFGEETDVIIREADYAFWEACVTELETVQTRRRVAVIGIPGIGKSTTSLFLIRKLLKMGKTVVYRVQTEQNFLQFSPHEDTATVHEQESKVEALQDKAAYYVIDPGKSKANCNPSGTVKAHVVITASPDERHWGGNSFAKNEPGFPGGFYRYFPPWSCTELEAACTLLSPPVTTRVVKDLYMIFGGVPRHVFDTEFQQDNTGDLKRTVEALSNAQAKNLVSGRFNVHATFGANQPYGGVVILHPSEDFKRVAVSLASTTVQLWIRSCFMDSIWTDLATYPTPISWQLLESYCRGAIMKTNMYTVRSCVGRSNPSYAQLFKVELGGCTSTSLRSDCTQAVLNGADEVLFYSSNRTHPLYDMIFKRGLVYFAFQVTIGRNHDAKQAQINEVANRLQIGVGGRELKLYYAVHDGLFDGFATNPVQPICPTGSSIYHLALRQHI